jgi:hypothetical protein
MPGTVDDFMNRFGGGGTIDDREAQQYHDLFVSKSPQDSAFDNQTYHQSATEYLGKLPDDQFQQAARNAVSQAPPADRQGLLGSLLGALGGAAAGGPANVASKIGLGSTDPSKMSTDDAARLMNYARTQQPEVLTKTVEEKPWFVKAMGNPVVMGTLAIAAAKLLADQRRKASGG